MRNLFFTALPTLGLGLATVSAFAASTIAGVRVATVTQQAGCVWRRPIRIKNQRKATWIA